MDNTCHVISLMGDPRFLTSLASYDVASIIRQTLWFRRAADAGEADGAGALAHMYTVGRGRTWQMMPASSSPSLETQLP